MQVTKNWQKTALGPKTVFCALVLGDAQNQFCHKLKINGKGRETPVADAATLVEIAWLCPGKAAVTFRRKGAESVCRMLGGDLTLVDEIQRRHTQVAGTAEEEFLLADVQGSSQQVISHKRTLEDDDEVYAAKKQQMLKQVKQKLPTQSLR